MTTFGNVFRAELLKLRKSPVWLLVLVSPALTTLVNLFEAGGDGGDPWVGALSTAALVHGLLFLPLLSGVFAAFVCRFEHAGGGWKQLLALPVSRGAVYVAKFAIVMGLLLATQALLLGGTLLAGAVRGWSAPIPWDAMAQSLLGGWAACLPIAALQLGASALWQSFAAPLALNVIFTLPSILIANSETYGPWYPWAQPALATIPWAAESFGAFEAPYGKLMLVVAGSFVLFFAAGFAYFSRKTA
jgi:hypothetical protein